MTGNQYRALYSRSPDEAYAALFSEYCDYVYVIVFNRLRSCATREDAEECISDIFADIFLGCGAGGGLVGDMKGFVGTVAKRRAINAYHRLSARAARRSDGNDEQLAAMDSGTDIEAEHDSEEVRRIILDKIDELGEPDSTIILQKYYYDRSSKEIAELLSMKSSAVRMRAARALGRLRDLLADVGITL
ncbi:MAG: sigma-70 family RNA polymerase sigma factor [Ruminococcus sp.]|nr:sigma-70 family RNA polymerase sigma factor [Ruminococcus sp.]